MFKFFNAIQIAGALPTLSEALPGGKPSIQVLKDTTNIPEEALSWPPPPKYSAVVKELGSFGSQADCEEACVNYVNVDVSPVSGWSRCLTYSWQSLSSGRCVAVVHDEEWNPRTEKGTTTGRLTWPPTPCSSDADCSYNGQCGAENVCECQPAWKGDRCQTLALLPMAKDWGLHSVDEGQNTSSWGGSVLLDPETGVFHMWAAEMVEHCGIDSWTTNSRVIRATASHGEGPYTRQEEVWPTFAHEPNVVRAPTGEWVMYFTAGQPGDPKPTACSICKDGKTPPNCPGGAAGTGPTYMSFAQSPEGPWSEPVELFKSQEGQWNMDTNLAMVILDDGSAVGICRTGGDPTGIIAHLATASDWRDPESYVGSWNEMLFPNTTIMDDAGVEDPHVYMDAQGIFHAVFHNQIEKDDERLCGGHAFSEDGLTWTFTGTAWSNVVHFTDGSSYPFSRRERPHVIFGDPANPFTITHLSTGVQYGEGSPVYSDGEDACYTPVQPVRTSQDSFAYV